MFGVTDNGTITFDLKPANIWVPHNETLERLDKFNFERFFDDENWNSERMTKTADELFKTTNELIYPFENVSGYYHGPLLKDIFAGTANMLGDHGKIILDAVRGLLYPVIQEQRKKMNESIVIIAEPKDLLDVVKSAEANEKVLDLRNQYEEVKWEMMLPPEELYCPSIEELEALKKLKNYRKALASVIDRYAKKKSHGG